jgi:hypothetical protein
MAVLTASPRPAHPRQAAALAAATVRVLMPAARRTPVAVIAVVAVAACSSQGAAKLPPKSSPPRAPASSPASSAGSAADAVAASYTAYFPVSKAAEAAGPSRARTMLAPYAAEPYLGHVLSQMAAYRARYEVPWGYVVPHLTQIDVRGALAQVHDCQNASHAALADSRTGRVISGTRGSARTSLIATLSRGHDGRWRLTSLAHVAVPCEPVPSPS